jgi:hypothetical protein
MATFARGRDSEADPEITRPTRSAPRRPARADVLRFAPVLMEWRMRQGARNSGISSPRVSIGTSPEVSRERIPAWWRPERYPRPRGFAVGCRPSLGERGLSDGESACRRGSVRPCGRGDHPSQRPTWGLLTWSGRATHVPRLALFRVGFTEPAESPRPLVRSYRTVSPLPVRARARHRRSALCCTFLRVAPTGR